MKAADVGDDAARRQFGNVTLIVEQSRDAWGWPWLEGAARDVRYGVRMVGRRAGFSTVVILTIAVGIGAASAMFWLVNAVLLRPLPYPAPERLVSLRETRLSADELTSRVAPARLEDWQHLTQMFEAIAGCNLEAFAETTGVVPEQVHVASVSPRFFTVLGTAPLQGRVFTQEEERFGGPKTIVISERLWRRRFDGSAGVLGRRLRLEGVGYVIVGVMPRHVEYPSPLIDAWITTQGDDDLMQDRGASARFYEAIGRLKPRVSLEQAHTDLNGIQRTLGRTYPKTDAGWGVALEPLKEHLVGSLRSTLWLLFGSVSLLLVTACANVGCLLLAQLDSRNGEVATRVALGASRGALARQLLVEAHVYVLLGGGLGILIAYASVNVIRQHLPALPRMSEVTVDGWVLGFATLVCLAAAAVCSMAPMIRLVRQNVIGPLAHGTRVVGGSQRITRTLVSAQLALATVLLVGAGLFLRGLLTLQSTPLGFEPDRVVALRVSASFSESPESVMERHQRTMDALGSLPGVRAVAMAHGLPGTTTVVPVEFHLAGEAADQAGEHFARRRFVTATYFKTLGVPLIAGETCRMNTDPQQEFQAVVNKAFVDRYAQGREVVGRSIVLGPQENSASTRIVGVAGNVREEGYAQPVEPVVYMCGFLRWLPDSDFLIQTAGQPASLARAAREVIHHIEPSRAVYSVQPLADAFSATLSQHRLRTLLVGAFSTIALTLAAIGLWGVMTYMVSERRREFGIRLALGARPPTIAFHILRSASGIAVTGAAVGLLLAAIASRVLQALMYGVRMSDPTAYAASVGILIGVVVMACISPGWRAMSVDPIEVLRE
ncbi:MAG TPA: ABC transporter permease [Vicinamibacterales bacterium]